MPDVYPMDILVFAQALSRSLHPETLGTPQLSLAAHRHLIIGLKYTVCLESWLSESEMGAQPCLFSLRLCQAACPPSEHHKSLLTFASFTDCSYTKHVPV